MNPAPSQAVPQRVPIRIVAATVAGSALEFYDFLTYAFFAVSIGRAFFPTHSALTSLLLSVGVFGVGFVFRPLGAVVIGAYADRAGRRPAMILTIALITVGTAGLALTPTYAAIGIAAPCIVVFCRLVQGLALGGEVGPTTAFLIEIAPPRERGLYSSWQFASQGIAGLAAGAIGIGVSLVLAPSDLAVWGWRIPFVLCLALLPIAIILRNAMPETLDTGSPAARRSRPSVKTHARLIVLAIFVIMGATVAAYVASYMTTYALTTLHFGPTQALGATVASGLGTLIFAPVGGALADRYGRRMVMLVPRIILAVVVYPLFVLLNHAPGEATLFGATLIVSALNTASAAASFVVVVELLPRPVRATGLAIAYAVGVSLFGGTTQFIIAYLGGVTGNPTSPAWYVALTSIITVGAMWALPETRDRALAE